MTPSPRFALAIALLALVGARVARAELPAGAIAFVHEDAGTTDPARQVFNLRLLDARDPSHQLALTTFGTPPALVQDTAWSRDFSTLAFSANVNGGLRSLEEQSLFAIGVDGTNLRQLTGFGLPTDLPGPTGTVTGTVAAPALQMGGQAVRGRLAACVVSAQGTSRTASCGESNGGFRLDGVPAGASWVRAQADVTYVDISLGLFDGPGLSIGFAPITVAVGRTVNAGTVRIDPQVAKSIQPSWSPDGRAIAATDAVRAVVLRQNPDTFAWEWTPTRGSRVVIWDLAGGTGPRLVPLPGSADVADLSGADWAASGRIACAATGTVGGRGGSFVLVVGPDGSDPRLVYQAPLSFVDPAVRLVLMVRWSPDGGRLAVVESASSIFDPAVGRSDILVMNADGSDVRRVTQSAPGEYAGGPSWSPDGSTIAFHVAVMPSLLTLVVERSDVFAVGADGTGLVRLTDDGRSSQPAWRQGGLPDLPPLRRCTNDAACDDGDACTSDSCSAGTCIAFPLVGFAGGRCSVDRLSGALCAPGEMDAAFRRFLAARIALARKSLAAAEATSRAKRKAKLVARADRTLASVAARATKSGHRRRKPLPAACVARIGQAVGVARQSIAPLR